MAKVLTVIGARPQFIKAATVSRAIIASDTFTECLVHTGQHYDENMSAIFFDEMGIPAPTHQLAVSGGSHGQMTGRMLEQLEQVFLAEKPDIVLVYGDTNSTLAGALGASKLNIPIAHVEAGLRSFNRAMPEETNRVLTDNCADMLFTPTDQATAHLLEEGIPADTITQVGDVMYDASILFGDMARKTDQSAVGVDFVLATIHRQENTDNLDRLTTIFQSLSAIARDRQVILPLHPRTKGRLEAAGLMSLTDALTIVEPMGYLDMVNHLRAASVVVTDSGGVQKEAFFFGVPCVTLRDETEWTELVDAGWNFLVPPVDVADVVAKVSGAVGVQGHPITPYGTGDAAHKIVAAMARFLNT